MSRDVLGEFQAWYLEQCNDDWEHAYGVTIGTLDNPGWTVDVDLADTRLSSRSYDRAETHRSENDWLVSWREEERWRAACGPLNLAEALTAFLDWARG